MEQDDQFHSIPIWTETTINDGFSPFALPDALRFPFEEQVPSPLTNHPFDGFQLSPTLIPMNPTPIPSFNQDENELASKEVPKILNLYPESNIQSEIKLTKTKSKPIPQPIFSSQTTSEAPVSSPPVANSQPLQTNAFFDKLSKVLDKPLTKEQIQLISSILPALTNSLNLSSIPSNMNYQSRKPFLNLPSYPASGLPRQSYQKNEEVDFNIICPESGFMVNPQKLGFIPASSWIDKEMSFGTLVSTFFQKRNNASSRFSHKLFNALRLSMEHPQLIPYIGVEWITPTILKVNKYAFARLLKIKTIDGSFFHHQGNFPSHGFVELTEKEACGILPPEFLCDVDYESVRLLTHPAGIFRRDCNGADIDDCKWINCRKKH